MAINTQAICTSFKVELLQAIHNFGVSVIRSSTGFDTMKAALYFAGTGLGAATTSYSATGEVTGTGYTAGGIGINNGVAPTSSGTTAYWTPSTNIQFTGITISSPFDSILVYNSQQNNRAICVLTFPQQTISSGTFTYTVPANTSTTALLQFN